jgi:hypothetical protein
VAAGTRGARPRTGGSVNLAPPLILIVPIVSMLGMYDGASTVAAIKEGYQTQERRNLLIKGDTRFDVNSSGADPATSDLICRKLLRQPPGVP